MRLLKTAGIILAVLAVIAVGFKIGDWWSSRESADEIEALRIKLGTTAETLEITEGLYSKKVIEYDDLAKQISGKDGQLGSLRKQLEDTNAKLLTAQQLTLKWKKAYEAILEASQSEEPTSDGVRKRVEFSGRLGPILATGHTLTDPAEAFLKLEQVDPLKLTIAVSQNKDRTWSTYVTSSDENLGITVDLAGVNPLVISPKWYQRIWMDVGAAVLGDPAGHVGLSYRGERISVGAMCYASAGSMNGCGATLGFRLFK